MSRSARLGLSVGVWVWTGALGLASISYSMVLVWKSKVLTQVQGWALLMEDIAQVDV